MKKFLGVMLFTLISTATYGQVLVSTFKLGKDEPFGCCPGRKMIKTKGLPAYKVDKKWKFKISEIENAVLSDAGLDITAFSLVCGRAVSSDQPEFRSVSFSCSYGGLLIAVEVTACRI